jgi:hypothetical protein
VLLAQVISCYLSLRGHLSDELREVNFCRTRLGELLQSLESIECDKARNKDPRPAEGLGSTPPSNAGEIGRPLFPSGARTCEEAVTQFLAAVTAEELNSLDTRMQTMIQQQFTALVHVCLTSASLMKNLETQMIQEATRFVESRMPVTDVAEMFLSQFTDVEEAKEEIRAVFDESAPEQIVSERPGRTSAIRFSLLAVPPGPAGKRFVELARQALVDVELIEIASGSDIIFYRECPNIPLVDLEQFGPAAREAYRQMSSVEHFTPHSRIDISRWYTSSTDRPVPVREQGSAAR